MTCSSRGPIDYFTSFFLFPLVFARQQIKPWEELLPVLYMCLRRGEKNMFLSFVAELKPRSNVAARRSGILFLDTTARQ